MANIVILKKNALSDGVTVLKNLSGGGSGIQQDPDWKMENLTSPDRYTYWRMDSTLAAATLDVDFDLGSSQLISHVCCTVYRFYGSVGFLTADFFIFYDNGSAYPPAAWTDDGFFLQMLKNDDVLVFDRTCRFLRFEFVSPGTPFALSFKLWAVRASDKIELAHDWGLETEFSNRRIKSSVRSPSGLLFEFEPQQSHASDVAGARLILSTASLTEWQTLRDGLAGISSRFIVLDTVNSRIYETTLPEGKIEADRRFSNLYSIVLPLEAHA